MTAIVCISANSFKGPLFSASLRASFILDFLALALLTGGKWCLTVVLICISLMSSFLHVWLWQILWNTLTRQLRAGKVSPWFHQGREDKATRTWSSWPYPIPSRNAESVEWLQLSSVSPLMQSKVLAREQGLSEWQVFPLQLAWHGQDNSHRHSQRPSAQVALDSDRLTIDTNCHTSWSVKLRYLLLICAFIWEVTSLIDCLRGWWQHTTTDEVESPIFTPILWVDLLTRLIASFPNLYVWFF